MNRKAIIVAIALATGGLHFVTGPGYDGPAPGFVNGYLIDLMLPFSMVLLMGLFEQPLLRAGWFRVLLFTAYGAFVETLQHLGFAFMGSTADPLDVLAYAAGAFAGLVFERQLLDRWFPRPVTDGHRTRPS